MNMQHLSRWLVILGLFLLSILLLVSGTAVLARDDTDTVSHWLHFGYDNAFTAYNPLEKTISITNVAEMENRWGIGCYDGAFSVIFRTPAIYEGTLYSSGAGDRLTAYDARSGQELWQFGNGNAGWAPQPVVSSDGTVFYMEETNPTYLYAVNGDTGAQLWKAPLGFELGYSGAAEAVVTVDEANHVVYLLEEPFSGDGKLYAIDKDSGAIQWTMSDATHGTGFTGSYALLSGGRIYAAADVAMDPYPFHGDHMLRINPGTQEVELTYNRPEPENYYAIEQVTLCNDRLVAGFDYQYDPEKLVVAYDPISTTIKWQKTFSSTITGKIACNTAKNQIYVPTDPYLYALDATDGEIVWAYLGYGEIYNPSVANGLVFLLSDNNMYVLDEETGVRIFRYPLGYQADETTQVAIADGMLFFSGNGGTCDLFALGPKGPKVLIPVVIR